MAYEVFDGAEDREVAFDRYGKFDVDQGMRDIEDLIKDLKARPECNGKVGVLGFCFDGRSAHLAAARLGVDAAAVTRVPLPPRSPNLHAYAERWVRSVKEECVSRFILFGERSLSHVLKEYVAHSHQERTHQGKGNVVLLPSPDQDPARQGPIQCRKRLGGLLKYYARDAA